MTTKNPRQPLVLSRRRALAAPAAALMAGVLGPALLSACGGGGGGDDAAAGGSNAQSYTSGPINGLGSIIVGGVRFDDSSARVEDDDDGNSRDRSVLRLGMVVEVSSSSIDDSSARAVAGLIRFGSELKGPVASIDSAAQTIRVLDQTVEVRAETVFDAALGGGFAALAVNQILEIHALFDSTSGHYLATRIELEDNANEYRLRGLVSQLDAGAKTFHIGDAVIDYATADLRDAPALADGQRVRVRLQTAQVGGKWVATRVRRGVRNIDGVPDARLRGFVNAFTSATQFQVNGIAIDAGSARVEGTVRDGALVEVRGNVANGTLIASRVKVIDRLGDEIKRFELHGTVSALDTAAQTFMLREVKVNYSRVAEWKDGGPADLANGKAVEVKGLWAEDRSVMFAAVIEFE
jgi:Domain of unknown function (DUF5666)